MKHTVDIETWERRDNYAFFRNFLNSWISVATEIDCTEARAAAKAAGRSFFLYYLYAVLRAVNEIKEFRYRTDSRGNVIWHDTVDVISPIAVPDRTFYTVRIPYHADFERFYAEARAIVTDIPQDGDPYGAEKVLQAQGDYDVFLLSATPDLDFSLTASCFARRRRGPSGAAGPEARSQAARTGGTCIFFAIFAAHGRRSGQIRRQIFVLPPAFRYICRMKRLITTMTLLAATLCAAAQEATLPTPDAKTLGMGGVAMTTLSGSHVIYNNSATAIFSQMPSQISLSYYGQGQFDYYAVTGFCRFDNVNLAQIGWRQYLRERGNNDMAVDLGYSRRIGGNWAVGVVARYMHLKRPETSADALAVDLSAAWSHPLENVGSYSTLRAGAKLGNLGGYLKDTPYTPPMDLTAGVALDTFLSDVHEITVGTDLGYYFSPSKVRGFQMSVGAEYNLMQLIQLRAGYHYGERRDYYPSYGSVGAGVRFLHLRLDFAYLIAKKQTLLHNTYSISFGLDF